MEKQLCGCDIDFTTDLLPQITESGILVNYIPFRLLITIYYCHRLSIDAATWCRLGTIEGVAHKHIVYHPRKLEPYFIELGRGDPTLPGSTLLGHGRAQRSLIANKLTFVYYGRQVREPRARRVGPQAGAKRA